VFCAAARCHDLILLFCALFDFLEFDVLFLEQTVNAFL